MSAVPPAIRDLPEATFQRQVLELAARTGWKAAHFHDSRRQITRRSGEKLVIGDKAAAGFPDMVLCRGRRVIFAELKTEKGRLSANQEAWLAALRVVEGDAAGRMLVRVWRPSDWADIERLLMTRAAA